MKGMISVVRRTGHSSYYVEKGMNAMGKTPKQLGIQPDLKICGGGQFMYFRATWIGLMFPVVAFPIWLEVRTNARPEPYVGG